MKRQRPNWQLASVLAVMLATPLLGSEVAAQSKGGGKGQNCQDVSVNAQFRDDALDSVQSDRGNYPGVVYCNNDTNNFSLTTEAGRGLRFILTNPSDPSDGGSLTLETGEVSANLGVAIPDSGGMYAMGPGTSAAAAKVQFNFESGGKRYFLSWGSNYGGTTAPLVTRTSETSWTIEASSVHIARLRECPSKGSCKNPVDRFFFAAVKIDLLAN
jgi:hypothetical protein